MTSIVFPLVASHVSHSRGVCGRFSTGMFGIAARLVRGCDLSLNLPRPPFEASGTSGMKAVINGGLNLSTLDGWWAEAYDGTIGWALASEVDPD